MIITDGEIHYALENKLVKKLDLMINRVMRTKQKQNAYIENHGSTGEGKTNTALIEAHYVKMKTKRDVHLFFRLSNLIEFAKTTEKKIIIWDEPSLDSLSTDQMKVLNRDLLRLINTARKKRHFIIINFTKFWRFPQDIVVDTCLGMVHMHSRGGNEPGRFLYIRQKNLESLWNAYAKYGKREFAKFKSFGGKMPEIIERILPSGERCFDKLDFWIENTPHATYDDYERLKDEAIASIGIHREKETKKEEKLKLDLTKVRFVLAGLVKQKVLTTKQVADLVGVNKGRVVDWWNKGLEAGFFLEKEGISLGNKDFGGSFKGTIFTSMDDVKENPTIEGESEGI